MLGGVLAWRIVVSSFGGPLASIAPGAALALASSNPVVLLDLAEREIADRALEGDDAGAGVDAAARQRAKAWAETASMESPLDARALRILGQLAEEEEAEKFMQAAVRRSLNESRALVWLLQKRFEQHRFGEAAQIGDLLMRTRPGLIETVTPLLARIAEDKEGFDEVARVVETAPVWRESFFVLLCDHVSDARTPFRLMAAAKRASTPPSLVSLRVYLFFLLRHRFYDFAYHAWRQFLPEERSAKVGNLFNGDFAFPATGLLFDWTLQSGNGATVEIVPRPGDENRRALAIEYDRDRASAHSVSEYLKLRAGAYRMSGLRRGQLVGRRGLKWRIVCADSKVELGESEMAMGRFSDWKRFEFEFVIPEKDCEIQQARLELDARTPSEWLVSGKMWYADLEIQAVGADSASSN
jgi:hypothetical protein